MIRILRTALLALALGSLGSALAAEPTASGCTEKSFADAVDKFGASLRAYNSEAQPRMRARLTALAEKKGWTGEDREERAMLYLEDGRLGELDTRANELLSKVDQLGVAGADGTYDCSRLAEIEAASIEILAVMKAKAAYLEDKVAREIGPGKIANAPTQAPAPAVPGAAQSGLPADKPAPPAAATTKAEPKAKPASPPAAIAKVDPPKPPAAGKPTPTERDGVWDSKLQAVVPPPGSPGNGPSASPAPGTNADVPPSLPPITFETADEGYTIDEIREATRGFFGTISTNLAGVIEYAFANSGRPTGYILGSEGGGAFLAGLRYGKGTLYLRQGGTRPIHWHGPSLGYDVGAEGGRTLILVYRMRDPDQLYRAFTGVDGSAYLVGGVGMTLLKGGDVIMAPIRSGIGLRLGANIGYLRFTAQPTWNPF
jgi:hypothetical protein